MSNSVKSIYDNLKSEIKRLLPDFIEMDYAYFPLKNQHSKNKKTYGVTIQEASEVTTVTRSITLDHTFNILLRSDYLSTSDDESNLIEVIAELYDALSTIYLNILDSKLNLPNLIYVIHPMSIDSPDIDEASNSVILNSPLIIKYRESLK
jgi:hypothetical protein